MQSNLSQKRAEFPPLTLTVSMATSTMTLIQLKAFRKSITDLFNNPELGLRASLSEHTVHNKALGGGATLVETDFTLEVFELFPIVEESEREAI